MTRDTFGPFDAVASLGAFEHFCSPEDYRAGRQEDVYRELFANTATVAARGRAPLPPDDGLRPEHDRPERVSIDAPRDSDEWYLALMQHQFPGSFLPFGSEQIVKHRGSRISGSSRARAAASTTSRRSSSGARASREPSWRKRLMKLQLVPRWLTSSEFRLAFTSGVSANSVCFERELLEHYRLVFEKA